MRKAIVGELNERFSVAPIKSSVGKEFIRTHHYSHGCHNGPMTWGLFEQNHLWGVVAFATPCSENVRKSVFGPHHVNSVTELHRLVVLDGTPSNTESWFIVRALAQLKEHKPNLRGVLSFADSSEGHTGTIYQATNAIFTGHTGRARFYIDDTGRLRHPRQNGHNVTLVEARKMGWTPQIRGEKYRYLYLLGTRTEKRMSRQELLLTPLPYPPGQPLAVPTTPG